PAIRQGRGYVWRSPLVAPQLERTARPDQPGSARLESNHRPIPGRRDKQHVRARDRRGDHLHLCVVLRLRVEIAEPPDFSAVLEVMPGRIIAAEHDQARPLPVLPQARRGVGLAADARRGALALDLPYFLA